MPETAITCVIPSAGDPASLARSLASLAKQTVDESFQVLVVLDGHAAAGGAAIQRLQARSDWPWAVRWLQLKTRCGPAAARNLGAREARDRYLLFLDDDMVAAPNFISAHLRLLSENPNTAIVGAIRTRCVGYAGVYRYYIESSWDERHQQLTHNPVTNFSECFSGNLAMERAVFQRVGGFDQSIRASHDVELGLRLQRAGVRLLYGSAAEAVQHFNKSPSQTMRDWEARGVTAAVLWRRHPEARGTIRFGGSSLVLQKNRWVRKLMLNTRYRFQSLAFILSWLPTTRLTERLLQLFRDIARTRGARREFPEDDEWTAVREGTLLLCYHGFSPAGGERSKYVIPVDQFARQIEVLESAGYRFISLSDWIESSRRREVIKGRTVIITVDDGSVDVAEQGAPVLLRKGVPVTLYVIRDWIGKKGFLDAAQIQALVRDGWEVGSHSLSHPRLPRIAEDRQRDEIAISRMALAQVAGKLPETFAYPYGDCDQSSQRIAREAGYAAALGIRAGSAYLHSPLFDLPRFVVDGRWPLWRFEFLVRGGISLPGLPWRSDRSAS
jgi:peptidoglycan/xylan/chitin deacetylase (PgdA/CDA1 family)/GT2 family glycosyltransferase